MDDKEFIKKCKQDKHVMFGVKCKTCGKYFYITDYIKLEIICCNSIAREYKPNRKSSTVLYERG